MFEKNDPLTGKIIGCAIQVHRILGPGLLESTYSQCLRYELEQMNLRVMHEVPIPIVYKNKTLECGYRLDLVVEEKVIVEIKSVAEILPVHPAQILTYMKLSMYKIGLLINFNVPLLKDGISRFILSS